MYFLNYANINHNSTMQINAQEIPLKMITHCQCGAQLAWVIYRLFADTVAVTAPLQWLLINRTYLSYKLRQTMMMSPLLLLLLLLGSTLTFQLKQIIIIWASFSIGRAMRQQQLKLSWAGQSSAERVVGACQEIAPQYRIELDFECDWCRVMICDLVVSFVFLAYAKLIIDLTSSVAA